MKIEIDRTEYETIQLASISAKMGGEWELVTADYKMPGSLQYVQVTEEYKAEKAKEAAALEAYRAKIKAEDEAKKATETAKAPAGEWDVNTPSKK